MCDTLSPPDRKVTNYYEILMVERGDPAIFWTKVTAFFYRSDTAKVALCQRHSIMTPGRLLNT